MVDLHTHTNASDGSYSPAQLIEAARAAGLEALAITDHDTLAGYDEAQPRAAGAGLELVCGIEISTKLARPGARARTVHLLGYFLDGGPSPGFRQWIRTLQDFRRDRNVRLAARLQSVGVDIRLEEVEAVGRSMAGRPHFARLLVEKGYASTIQQAFDLYLDESARAFVFHDSPTLEESIRQVCDGRGLAALAHPVRLSRDPRQEEALVQELAAGGLGGLEAIHSDHEPSDVARYRALADRWGLAVTGGSDFHGDAKPGVELGMGRNGNVAVPRQVLDRLRSARR